MREGVGDCACRQGSGADPRHHPHHVGGGHHRLPVHAPYPGGPSGHHDGGGWLCLRRGDREPAPGVPSGQAPVAAVAPLRRRSGARGPGELLHPEAAGGRPHRRAAPGHRGTGPGGALVRPDPRRAHRHPLGRPTILPPGPPQHGWGLRGHLPARVLAGHHGHLDLLGQVEMVASRWPHRLRGWPESGHWLLRLG